MKERIVFTRGVFSVCLCITSLPVSVITVYPIIMKKVSADFEGSVMNL